MTSDELFSVGGINGQQEEFSVVIGGNSEDRYLVLRRRLVELTLVVLLQVLSLQIEMRGWWRYSPVLTERRYSFPVSTEEDLIKDYTIRYLDVVLDGTTDFHQHTPRGRLRYSYES